MTPYHRPLQLLVRPVAIPLALHGFGETETPVIPTIQSVAASMLWDRRCPSPPQWSNCLPSTSTILSGSAFIRASVHSHRSRRVA